MSTDDYLNKRASEWPCFTYYSLLVRQKSLYQRKDGASYHGPAFILSFPYSAA
jgi:hypothetical protein